ncbi:MAG: hypothetical protein JSU81_11440 [Candidatus Coatesbacteria bacterium]|nr:MAG: hypothetical protein JSU81_11440 [Candidatus Coatesbacteria bacterium]
MRGLGAVIFAVAVAAGAWAADYEVARPAAPPATTGDPASDASIELKWDSGVAQWLICYYTGAGTWMGNDFDISTLSTYRAIESFKMYSSARWPNGRWDGFRIGIWSVSGGVPGSMLWGPKAVVGSGSGDRWIQFRVGWTLPSANNAFCAAFEQYYNYPNCDPHLVDNNRTFLRHSWLYYGGRWQPYSNSTGYYNLMVRVIVDNSTLPVVPTSLGHVKALYH